MTERETETAARRGGLAWQKARRVRGLGRVNGFPDWPDAFIPAELAALQYPREGDTTAKRKALTNQRAMVDALDAAIQAGEVGDTITLQREIIKTESGRFAGMEFNGEWIPASTVFRKVSAGIREYQAIHRTPFASWLDGQGEEPSEHIRAWLGDAWPVAAVLADVPEMQGTAKPARKARNGKGDRLEMAVIAGLKAYRAKHKTDPTADALFEWLAEHDETGTIEDADDEKLWWKKADGNLKPITRKAFANRLTTIKPKTPA